MQYVGIQTQQSRNNFRSLLLLCLFPCLVMGLLFAFCYLLHLLAMNDDGLTGAELLGYSTGMFIHLAPYVLGGVLIWFIIAYFANTSIINSATGSEPLSRMENKRVYNLVENLCMSQGMKMPKINIINDDSLNAFASGDHRQVERPRTGSGHCTRAVAYPQQRRAPDDRIDCLCRHLCHARTDGHAFRLLLVDEPQERREKQHCDHHRLSHGCCSHRLFLLHADAFRHLAQTGIPGRRRGCRDDQESARPRQRTTENLGRSRHRSRQTRRRSPAFHPASGPTGQKRTERFKRTFRHSSTH